MAQFLIIGDPNDLHTRFRVEFLMQRGHGVELLCEQNEMTRSIKNNGPLPWIHPKALPYFSWKNRQLRREGAHLITERIGQIGAQLLLIMYGEPHVGWAYYHQQFKIPIALHTYGTDALVTLPQITQAGLLAPLRKYLFKRAFAGVQLHVASSRKQFETLQHLSNPRIIQQLVRIGINSKALDAFKATPSASKLDRPYVIFPRMMHPIYNHDIALDAIALLPKEILRAYSFVFIDADSRHTSYTTTIKAKMDAQADVQFEWLPRLDSIALWTWIQHARLSVQLPATDASAITALETLYLETPLLLGPADYDHDLYAGIQRTLLTPQEIANNITRLLQHGMTQIVSVETLRKLTDSEAQSLLLENHLLTLIENNSEL
jgi:glycosyltransferase involved in cell wall biosynthesis